MAIPSVTISANKLKLMVGQTLTITTVTELDPADVFVSYRWQKGGVDVAGQTTDTFTKTVAAGDTGTYTLIVKHGVDEATATETTSNAVAFTQLAVLAFSTNLSATQSVILGKTLTLTVAVTGGASPYTYAWKKAGAAVGTNAATYTKASFAAGDTGAYTVEVTDSESNKITSATCTVSSLPALSFSTNLPATKTVAEGAELKLTVVVAGGVAPYTYVWKKGGTAVSGQTTASLTIASATDGTDDGSYTVEVTDAETTKITSVACVVTVDATPVVLEARWTVHPIPWRTTSFTPLGYWVLDEILYQKAQGNDWKTDYATYKYSADVETILKAFNENGECEVQDSRNGYIHKMSLI